MAYYSSYITSIMRDYFPDNPRSIIEITIPTINSRENDLRKLADKRGYSILRQVRFGNENPNVRILRAEVRIPDLLAFEKSLRMDIRSLKTLGIRPSHLYHAIVIPSAVELYNRFSEHGLYIVGFKGYENIFTFDTTDGLKTLSQLSIGEYSAYHHATHIATSDCMCIYKTEGDPETQYSVNLKTSEGHHAKLGVRGITRIEEFIHGSNLLNQIPREQRLLLINQPISS